VKRHAWRLADCRVPLAPTETFSPLLSIRLRMEPKANATSNPFNSAAGLHLHATCMHCTAHSYKLTVSYYSSWLAMVS
jgi:hypothetical protein